MYDFTIPEDATYVAGGFVVHNCDSCAAMDGTEFVTTEQAYESYPDAGPYSRCDGGDRCRGTLVFVYEELDPSSAPATG